MRRSEAALVTLVVALLLLTVAGLAGFQAHHVIVRIGHEISGAQR